MALTLLQATVRINELATWISGHTVNTIQSVTLLSDGGTLLIVYT